MTETKALIVELYEKYSTKDEDKRTFNIPEYKF